MTPKNSVHSPTDEKLVFPTLGRPFDRLSYGQTQSSPYEHPLVTISIGDCRYGIPRSYLDNYPRLTQLHRTGTLPLPVSPDIGHTIVHYLYTGKWQTIDSGMSCKKTYMEREYQRCVQVYHASIKYDLSELKIMAEKYIAHSGYAFSAIELLRLTTEVFSELPEDEFWLPKYVTNRLQEMASRGKPTVNIRDNSTVSNAGSSAIMAAVIEAQSSHIMELESRIAYQVRTGIAMHNYGTGYYPYSYNAHPRPVSPSSVGSASPRRPCYVRPASPIHAADAASFGIRRYPRSASPSSAAASALPRASRYARSASPSSQEDSDVVGESPNTPDGSSEHSALMKDCLSVAATEDGSHAKEWTGHPDGPVMEKPVEVLAYEESVVEAVEASVDEESIADNSVTEGAFTGDPVGEELVKVIVYEESIPDDPVAGEPAWEQPVGEEPVSEELTTEPIAPEANRTHSLLLNSDLYKDWKTLSPKKRRTRTKKLKRQGLPIPDQDGIISITLA